MTGSPLRFALIAAVLAAAPIVFALILIPAVLPTTVAVCPTPAPSPPTGSGSWIATAYGPPWDAINGSGVTATGLNLTAGPPAYEVAVDPSVIRLRSFVHVQPNPFGTTSAFYAGDTGGAIIGQHVDIYDWRGRAYQDAWGLRHVTVTPAANPGAGNVLGNVQAPALLPAAGDCATAGGYQNQFAHSTQLVSLRIDMGVDYSGVGAIDAIGNGIVTYLAYANAGWGPFSCTGGHGGAVVYRLTDGPDRGRYVYDAEGIIPTVAAGVLLTAGQQIATFTGCIETGWASGIGDQPMGQALGQQCASGDAGCHSTACGWSMSQLIVATGGPAGVLQPGGIFGRGC